MEDTAYEQKNLPETLPENLRENLPEILRKNLSDEEIAVYVNFPQSKKKAIGYLSEPQQTAWCNLHRQIVVEKKEKDALENTLLNDNLKGDNLLTAYGYVDAIKRELRELYKQEDILLCPQKEEKSNSNSNYDRNARPGVVSIRPTYKGTPTPPRVRHKK